MQAWKILVHSVRQVFGNLGPSLRISGLLYVLQWAVLMFVDRRIGDDLAQAATGGGSEAASAAALFGPAVLSLAVLLVVDIWVAVAWHRYILRSELPHGLLPRFAWRRNLGYCGALLALIVVFGVLAAAAVMLAGVVAAGFGSGLLAQAIPAALLVLGAGLMLRLATVLAGFALEPGHRLNEGWEATRGKTGDFLLLALMAGAAMNLVQILTLSLFAGQPLLLLAVTFLAQWVVTMVGVSVLTTLYGHYIEGRTLV